MTEREEFEKVMQVCGYMPWLFERYEDTGHYKDELGASLWRAWQAARSSPKQGEAATADLGAIGEQAEAWGAVVNVLNGVSPGWTSLTNRGIDSACAAIRVLAKAGEPPPQVEPAGWQPIETAPKDGTRFVNMYYVTVVGVGLPIRYERHFQICRREFSSLGSSGYWTNEHVSVPDHSLRGWWHPIAHPIPAAPKEPNP